MLVLRFLAVGALAGAALLAGARAGHAEGGAAPPLGTLAPALAALGGDLVTWAAGSDEAEVATLVAAPAGEVAALLGAPSSYPQAVPALVRVEVIARRPRTDGNTDLLIDWELEIPLFNLKGRLWVIPGGDRITLDLFQGNFAPGRLLFRWAAAGGGRTVLALAARINNQAGGWLLRQLVARSRYAGAAVNAAAAFVAARGLAAVADHPGDPNARRPHGPPTPPALAAIDGRALGERLMLAPAPPPRALALVKRTPSGRLAMASVGVLSQLPALTAQQRLAAPETWRAFPGWKHVDRLASGGDGAAIDVDVRDNIPFVDFDARWRLTTRPAPRALAVDGDARGALFGWDLVQTAPPRLPATAAVLSMYPRVEALGYVPRKFVAAEPLLEQALALALAYVDAMSAIARVDSAPAQ